mmetsp:Transcript_27750/g.50131  ORF Transcript_27750/g.50131 Transcript_27750/m.50131 type:complete len:524 (-) Transcript_27750:90-1661(-)
MLRKLLGKDSEVFCSSEEAAINRLAASHRRLLSDGDAGRVNTKSEAGYNACASFLEGMDAAARALHLEAASRSYRTHFTINYRALFPDEARNYRVDVLEASVEQYSVIWVNGDKFEFSQEAMRRAEALQRTWCTMTTLLENWNSPNEQIRPRSLKSEIRNAMVALDISWASFEDKYISELIDIEEKARRLIVQAIERERALKALEDGHSNYSALLKEQDYQEALRAFVASISHLNSVANFRRKGRDDLTIHVLVDAHETLARCDMAEKNGESTDLLASARQLAEEVVSSFLQIRSYLREVEKCLERVDPHLCNNAGLVAKLVDWEESWEVGTRYVQHEKLMAAICDVVAECKSAKHFAPALAAMWEECDVELFMVLPRLLWLRFLMEPNKQVVLLKSILPHRFPEEALFSDPELKPLWQKYQAASNSISPAGGGIPAKSRTAQISEVLIKRAIDAQPEDLYRGMSQGARHAAEAAVEDFMGDLETWSMELQRHCPEDWNQCAAIIVSCLSGNRQKGAPGQFRV